MDRKRLKNSIMGGILICLSTLFNGTLGMAILKTDSFIVTLFCWLIATTSYELTLVLLDKINR